ncbi:hypothetical protein ACFW0S_28585, partial [Citrobacter freundii]
VQTAMVIYGWRQGEKIGVLKGAGLLLAVAGTVLLLLPGAHAPEPTSALMMIGSGLAWAMSFNAFSSPELSFAIDPVELVWADVSLCAALVLWACTAAVLNIAATADAISTTFKLLRFCMLFS